MNKNSKKITSEVFSAAPSGTEEESSSSVPGSALSPSFPCSLSLSLYSSSSRRGLSAGYRALSSSFPSAAARVEGLEVSRDESQKERGGRKVEPKEREKPLPFSYFVPAASPCVSITTIYLPSPPPPNTNTSRGMNEKNKKTNLPFKNIKKAKKQPFFPHRPEQGTVCKRLHEAFSLYVCVPLDCKIGALSGHTTYKGTRRGEERGGERREKEQTGK